MRPGRWWRRHGQRCQRLAGYLRPRLLRVAGTCRWLTTLSRSAEHRAYRSLGGGRATAVPAASVGFGPDRGTGLTVALCVMVDSTFAWRSGARCPLWSAPLELQSREPPGSRLHASLLLIPLSCTAATGCNRAHAAAGSRKAKHPSVGWAGGGFSENLNEDDAVCSRLHLSSRGGGAVPALASW